MKNKKGFTLAEVLITLTIIGTIASITLPSLSLDVQRQKIGPAFAKAVNTLENAHMDLLRTTEASNILDACDMLINSFNPDRYIRCLATKSNLKSSATIVNGKIVLQTKDGIAYIVPHQKLTHVDTPSNKHYGYYFTIDIDIDGGNKGSNQLGLDQFKVIVDLGGEVIPYGSSSYINYMSSGTISIPLWQKNCNKDIVKDPQYCAGSIADNGWQAIYKLQLVK